MTTRIYFSHGLLFLYDSTEQAPGNDWTPKHTAQGFARRPTAANIATLSDDGLLVVERGSPELLDRCERAVVVSVRSDSGSISMSGIDPEDHVVWKGRPGWVRVTVGQLRGPDERELLCFVVADERATEEPTFVRLDREWLSGPFIETAAPARYSRSNPTT